MMKYLTKTSILTAALALSSAVGSLNAVTLNWGGAAFEADYFSDGTALDDSVTFELGYFQTITNPDISNATQWDADFVTLDSSAYNVTNQFFTGTYNTSDNLSLNPPAGTQLYIFAYTDRLIGIDTEFALITGTGPGLDSNFIFPDLDNTTQADLTTQFRVSTSNNAIVGRTDDSTGQGNSTDNPILSQGGIQLFTIPEPSSVMLLFIGATGLLVRRKR